MTKVRSGLPSWAQKPLRILMTRLCVHENVSYGVGLRVGRGSVISSPHHLNLGRWVSIGPHSIVQVDGEISDFALIGMNVQIAGRRDHYIHEVGRPSSLGTWVGDRPPQPSDAVHIGRDVWIGGGSTVLSGVSIGEGSVVGAASVVTKDIPAFSIAIGNPARVIKERFSPTDARAHSTRLDDLTKALESRSNATATQLLQRWRQENE